MWYDIKTITSSKQPKYTSAIVALQLPEDVAKKIKLDKKECPNGDITIPDQMHITLLYLGEANDYDKDEKNLIIETLKTFFSNKKVFKGRIGGVGSFAPMHGKDTFPFYASYDCADLPEIRQDLIDTLARKGIVFEQNHGFTPHITLAYLPVDDNIPNIKPIDCNCDIEDVVLYWSSKKILKIKLDN